MTSPDSIKTAPQEDGPYLNAVDLFVNEPVAKDFVAAVEISPVLSPPDVVIWGNRVFILHSAMPNVRPAYIECFSAVAIRQL